MPLYLKKSDVTYVWNKTNSLRTNVNSNAVHSDCSVLHISPSATGYGTNVSLWKRKWQRESCRPRISTYVAQWHIDSDVKHLARQVRPLLTTVVGIDGRYLRQVCTQPCRCIYFLQLSCYARHGNIIYDTLERHATDFHTRNHHPDCELLHNRWDGFSKPD